MFRQRGCESTQPSNGGGGAREDRHVCGGSAVGLMPIVGQLRFRPQLDKIVELLLYLSHVRPNCDKYQAVKFLYLADKEHLNRYGRPITFETYYALPYGPVAPHAMDLLKRDAAVMRKAGIEELPFEVEELDMITYIRAPKRSVNHDIFSKSDLDIFDDVIERYGKYSFFDLFELTHSHFAYKNAWENRRRGTQRAEMSYDDMVDETARKQALINDISPVSEHMR